MKIFLRENVFDATLNRIRRIFDEFENVVVNTSGGKDSTVVFNLAMIVAEEKKRLPLKVMFIDQEAEWQSVIDYMRIVMNDKRVEPYWLQMPMVLQNGTSATESWLHCWEEGKKWIREKEPNSLKVNKYGTDRFKKLFSAFIDTEFLNEPACQLGGMRAEESPARFLGITGAATYKDITWGKKDNKDKYHYSFYPIYDWTYADDWKAIHDNKWEYCKLYDYMYQYGVPVKDMRVSNVHHETAIMHLFHLQEIEGETWNKITERISGISTAGQIGTDDYFIHKDIPYMFKSWGEYRDYLLENLVPSEEIKEKYKKRFSAMDLKFSKGYYLFDNVDRLHKAHINTIMANDFEFTKLSGFEASYRNKVGRKTRA